MGLHGWAGAHSICSTKITLYWNISLGLWTFVAKMTPRLKCGFCSYNGTGGIAIQKTHMQSSLLNSHYIDVIMGGMASQITSLTIAYSTVYSGADQSKHQSSASLAFLWGIYRGPVNSPHKWPVTWKIFSFVDVIMQTLLTFDYLLPFSSRAMEWKLVRCEALIRQSFQMFQNFKWPLVTDAFDLKMDFSWILQKLYACHRNAAVSSAHTHMRIFIGCSYGNGVYSCRPKLHLTFFIFCWIWLLSLVSWLTYTFLHIFWYRDFYLVNKVSHNV